MLRAIAIAAAVTGIMTAGSCEGFAPNGQDGANPDPAIAPAEPQQNGGRDQVRYRVDYDGHVDIVYTVDGNGRAVSPKQSPWIQYVPVKIGGAVKITVLSPNGFATCKIYKGTTLVDQQSQTGFGSKTCAIALLGPNIGS